MERLCDACLVLGKPLDPSREIAFEAKDPMLAVVKLVLKSPIFFHKNTREADRAKSTVIPTVNSVSLKAFGAVHRQVFHTVRMRLRLLFRRLRLIPSGSALTR